MGFGEIIFLLSTNHLIMTLNIILNSLANMTHHPIVVGLCLLSLKTFPSTQMARSLLNGHVIEGTWYSRGLSRQKMLTTKNGVTVTFREAGDGMVVLLQS